MQIFKLIRDYKPEATFGRLLDDKGNEICQILERPKIYENKENLSDDPKTKVNESCCIPEGEYVVEFTYSPKFEHKLFLVCNVSHRDGIRIHAANYVSELKGCLAPAMKIIDQGEKVAPDQRYKGINSVEALNKLTAILPKKFTLKITSNQTLCTV